MAKKLLYLVAFLVATTVQANADNLGYSKSHPLLFGVDMDYAPLEYVDSEGLPHGYDVEFTQELMRRLNIPFTYSPNTWENISGDVLNGRVDLGMMVYSSYRKDITNYSRAIFRLYYQIIYRKQDKGEIDVRNLAGKSVAYMASRPITDTLTRMGAVLNVVRDLPQATVSLSKGKYDAIICFRYQARYIIKEYGLNNLTTEDLALPPREYCYVSHSRELIDSIDDELEKMEAEGIVQQIYGDSISIPFDGFTIPRWVWYALTGLFVAFLLAFIVVQNRHQKVLRREMERAQESERLKTIFLGNVSHALRTPLNSIIGFSDVLRNANTGEISQKEAVGMLGLINDNGKQLLYFINELLQLSDIESNNIRLNRVEINLRELMDDLARQVRPKLQEGVTLKVEGTGGYAIADPKFMKLVTMHCLDNAVKYTRQGCVTLAYWPEKGGLHIEVRDTGPGLPEGLRDNIFSLLTNRNTYVQDEVPGLGLSICKAIVDNSGGRIGAESPPEGGTILWHWVPVKVKST